MSITHQLQFLHRLAQLAAIGVILLGVMVLFAWVAGIPVLYQVSADFPPMMPSSAVSFIFVGAALFLLQPEHVSVFRKTVGLALAAGGFLLGILLLLGYFYAIPDPLLLGLSGVVGPVDLSTLTGSPHSAAAFTLTCVGLFFLGLERPALVSVAQWAALLSVMALVVVFFGYAHKEDMFYAFSGAHGMALLATTGFALVGWGIILAKVEKGFLRIMVSDSVGGVVVRRVLFWVGLFPILLGWLPVLLHTEWFSHTQVAVLLASLMILAIVAIVILMAYRLNHQEALRRRAEEEARQHQADLAHVVRLNTMGEMASGIAHEINQPLAAVANYASACQRMIQSGQEAQQLLEPLVAIQQQARRASEIIRRLRTFVRKQQPQKTMTCLEQLIHEALLLTKTTVTKHNIPLLLELDENVPDISVDIIQIQQVILNIVQNAIDAMRETAVYRQQVMVHSFLNAEGLVQVDISDTGPGMDEELKQRVFDAFVTTKGSRGMGIGLSLCRSIIESHGGRLWVKSAPGQGATFSFTLPVD